jgi:hypothetical protein
MSAEFYDTPLALEDRRLVRVINPAATLSGHTAAYINDLIENTGLEVKHAPQVHTHSNPAYTLEELWRVVRPGDLLHVEGSDGTVRQVVEFAASRKSPYDLALMTSPIGNAKNDHKNLVAKKLWKQPSEVIKHGDLAAVYPLRAYVFQPENEKKDLPAESDVELAVAIRSIGGIATGAVYLEASKRRGRRSVLKQRMHALFGSDAAELATLLYDTYISVRALPHIGNIRYAEHPNGLETSVAEAFVNAYKVAKVARFKKADLLEPGFEYGTIGAGRLRQSLAIGQLLLGKLPAETIPLGSNRQLRFRLAPDQAAYMERDGDPKFLREGSTVIADQVGWDDPLHQPVNMVVMQTAA